MEFDEATNCVDESSPFIIRYLTKNEGSINSNAETEKFGHLKQQAYSLVGKGTALFDCEGGGECPATTNSHQQYRIMTTVDGAIITGKNTPGHSSPDKPGAHMGLDLQFLRFVDGFDFAIGPITLECTSDEAKTAPDEWICNVKAELQGAPIDLVVAISLPIELEKVKPVDEPGCSVFQDGGGDLPIVEPPDEPPV